MDARKWPGSLQRCLCMCMCYVLWYTCACAAGCADLCPGEGRRGRGRERGWRGGRRRRRRDGETRCGTHSLSMGHSHSLDREGNSAAVLNPANWRNSTTEPPLPALPSYLLELCPRIPPYYFPPSFRRAFAGPSLSLPSPKRCITRRSSTDTESIFAMMISPRGSRSNRSKIHAPAFVSRAPSSNSMGTRESTVHLCARRLNSNYVTVCPLHIVVKLMTST